MVNNLLKLDNTPRYYVYCLIDPRTSQPFYVGKGSGQRMFQHRSYALQQVNGKYKHHHPLHYRIRDIIHAGAEIQYKKLVSGVTEYEAYAKERELVEEYGRVRADTGVLLNLCQGGINSGGRSCRPVSQFNKAGEHIADFESALIASESLPKANASYISQCCQGNRVSAGGFLWAYKGTLPKKTTRANQRKVNQYNLDGSLVASHMGVSEAATSYGLRPQDISGCCRHKVKTVGGFIWAYDGVTPDLDINKTKYTKVQQYTRGGKLVGTYMNARAASKELGLVSQNITKCCKGEISHVGGYLWKYLDLKKEA